MKLLTVCIPTYKRKNTLLRCLDSVVSQIKQYDLSDCVDVYVVDDASPDDRQDVIEKHESLNYFNFITREQNLGMNKNIKCMLNEVAKKSNYQLIITDDDYLQSNILGEIVEFLHGQQSNNSRTQAIWTPRYSYTEDGALHCIACSPFEKDTFVEPSTINVARYMNNGFVLSGLIIQASAIDFNFWDTYTKNAYFPMIVFGDLFLRNGAFYWDKNIVHHTVLNDCHWERWGNSDVMINLRLFSDYINAFSVVATKIKNSSMTLFYFASFRGIYRITNLRINSYSPLTKAEWFQIFNVIKELKIKNISIFNMQIKLLLLTSILFSFFILPVKLTRNYISTHLNSSNKKDFNIRKPLKLRPIKVTIILFILFIYGL